MGLLTALTVPVERLVQTLPSWQLALLSLSALIPLLIISNVLKQLLFSKVDEPPVVFHWFPFIGSTIAYGIDPYKFFFSSREKYGDVFTFILLGKKTTVYLGLKGNDFILNGKHKDVNAEEVYTPLTTPVFGTDVIYDCPNSKLIEQKKFVKFGLTTDAFKSYVSLIANEVEQYVATAPAFRGQSGVFNVGRTVAEITIYTASRSLQGKEVRERFSSKFADLYHDLDMGFAPINFMLPWAPLPHNRKRDYAQRKMASTYMDIIQERKNAGDQKEHEEDMIRNLMSCVYKNGTPLPDQEIAHMMIALLMAGQHSSSSSLAWIVLRLATRPDIQEELLLEQKNVLGQNLPPLTHQGLESLPLHLQVIKETLRLHAPIHSMMRKVKTPMSTTVVSSSTPSSNKSYVIPTTHTLLAAPGVTARLPDFFPEPDLWEPHRWEPGHPLAYRPALSAKDLNGEVVEESDEKYDYGYGLVSKGANSPYLPFGAGRHRCIGEQFAYVQLGTILACLVRSLKFSTISSTAPFPNTDYSSLFSRALEPTDVRWERRKGMGEGEGKEEEN